VDFKSLWDNPALSSRYVFHNYTPFSEFTC
jgi:hypothetical protein